jgi:hypothetical protein
MPARLQPVLSRDGAEPNAAREHRFIVAAWRVP